MKLTVLKQVLFGDTEEAERKDKKESNESAGFSKGGKSPGTQPSMKV